VEAGMNSAIVNASKILPLNRFDEREIEVALDLIYDRRKFEGDVCTYDPLGEFTTMFQGKTAQSMKVDVSNLSTEEKLKHHIIDGEKIGLEDNLKKALESYPALEISQRYSARRNENVGDLFGSVRCSCRSFCSRRK
jgi:5-methyltetrahydrofolate--homocysteine methyltransferase